MEKTAIELLIARIDRMESKNVSVINIWATELLRIEKQQIMDAYDAGLMEQSNSIDYFFDKYENVSK